MTDVHEKRLVELEMRLTFAQDQLATLGSVMLEKDRLLLDLEGRVQRLESALRILSSRVADTDTRAEVLGANADEDPVPSSG